MPDPPHLPVRVPPIKPRPAELSKPTGPEPAGFAEVYCRTNFSFLAAASHPDELADRAAALGYAALAVTDLNSLAGAVRAHVAAREAGMKLLVGAEVTLDDGPLAVLLATDLAGYGNLSRLITAGRRRAEKGACRLSFADVAAHAGGLLACLPLWPHVVSAEATDEALPRLHDYRDAFGDRAYALAGLFLGPEDKLALKRMGGLAKETRLPLVATNAPLIHDAARRYLLAVLTCIRLKKSIYELSDELPPNGERHLKSGDDMRRLFRARPDAIRRTLEVASRCSFSLSELKYEYPEELVPAGETAIGYLSRLTWAGVRERYPDGIPDKVRNGVEHELRLIETLGYEAYFLTVHDLVRFARSQGILCQGRGSAANSSVCYYLGVTSVDPDKHDLLFERFVSAERGEPPDIDIDFEHQRREEVIQYAYGKYGRSRCGMTANVITYRPKSAVRDVAKALGLSVDRVDRLAKSLEHYGRGEDLRARTAEAGLDPDGRVARQLLHLVDELLGFPHHLSQHPGGLVLTRGRLDDFVPIENARMKDRTVIQWSKDDLDAVGILKVDCLALGMLTAIRRCFGLVERHHGRKLTLGDVPPEDPAVYAMIRRADSIGVFQAESRVQLATAPRLKPETFYDLVIQIALIRPGPIQGDMVNPYLKRRAGKEPVAYPSPEVEAILHKTLGVCLFQEQAMRLAMAAAGFTAGEADRLRRAMAAWRRPGLIDAYRERLISGMLANGYTREYAEQLYKQIEGFGSYGFPESHSASFAQLAYVSAWLKCYHPAAFTAALLNSLPMGFYEPPQLVGDARKHGAEVQPVDVNASGWESTLEPSRCRGGFALRLGFRLVGGLREDHAERIVAARRDGDPFRSVGDLSRRTKLAKPTLALLAAADAFGSLKLGRRPATWQALGAGEASPLYDAPKPEAKAPALPRLAPPEEVAADYRTVGLSLKGHPMEFVRPLLDRQRVLPCSKLGSARDGAFVKVGGLVLHRQRPSSAKGVTFVTLEDEGGTANLIVYTDVWQRFRKAARFSSAMLVSGRVQRDDGGTTHVIVAWLGDLSEAVGVAVRSRDFH